MHHVHGTSTQLYQLQRPQGPVLVQIYTRLYGPSYLSVVSRARRRRLTVFLGTRFDYTCPRHPTVPVTGYCFGSLLYAWSYPHCLRSCTYTAQRLRWPTLGSSAKDVHRGVTTLGPHGHATSASNHKELANPTRLPYNSRITHMLTAFLSTGIDSK